MGLKDILATLRSSQQEVALPPLFTTGGARVSDPCERFKDVVVPALTD